MDNWSAYMQFFIGLISIVNPIGAVPIFVNITSSMTLDERHRTGFMAAVALCAFCGGTVSGSAILNFRHHDTILPVAGGILILLMSISMMHAKISPTKQNEEESNATTDRDSVAVVPLGIPLLAGQGAISAVIVFASRGHSPLHYLVLGVEIVLVAAIVWVSFRSAPYIERLLGRTGINVVMRIMGLIMTAVAVEFITGGLRQIFPVLG